jgi:hypothetical protein
MAVAKTDMKWRKPTTIATSFSTSTIGGAKTATNLTSATLDELIFSTSAEASGGSNVVQYAKIFLANTHATDAASSVGVWIANSLDTPAAAAVVKFVSSSTSDNTTKKILIKGYDSSGVPQSEYRTLNGTTEVTSSLTYSVTTARNLTCEYVDADNVRANSVGIITVTHNVTVLGYIPAGCSFAATGIAIGVTATVDDSQTTTNASTAPSGISFSAPNLTAEKILTNGSGALAAGVAQGYWIRVTLTPGQQAVTTFSVIPLASGA